MYNNAICSIKIAIFFLPCLLIFAKPSFVDMASETAAERPGDPSSGATARTAARLPLRRSRGCMFPLLPSSLSPDPHDFDFVDPALLVPPDVPIRGGWRTDAGLVLDGELVALAAAEARCRLVRARIAARLIAVRAWRALGFVRLADFARERLGVSPRSLEDDAHVVRALESLPVLAVALETGALSWTRLHLLLRVATAGNEMDLLEQSRSVAMRDLEEFVKGYGAAVDASESVDSAQPCGGEASAGASRSPGSSPVTESSPLNRDAAPSAASPGAESSPRESSRENLNASSSASASSEDDPFVRWSIHLSRSGRRMWRAACEYASRMAGAPLSPWQVLELVAGEAATGSVASPPCEDCAPWRAMPTPEMHEQRLRESLRVREARGRRFLLAFLAETGVAEGFAWLDPASGDPGPARTLDFLAQDLDRCDAFELERRLQQLRSLSQRLDAQIAALMRTGIDRRLFREIGFATVKLYAEARLGLSARRIWNLVTLERESWRHSRLLHDAFRDGRLTALQATALLPVLSEKYAEAWIERATGVTLRRLQDEVAWALDHPGQIHDHCRLFAPPPPGADVRADALADVTDAEVQNRAHAPQVTPDLGPPGEVRMDFALPLSVAVLVETTLDALRWPKAARWMIFERMTALALLEWKSAPKHSDPVFERDGWRCAVPACSSRQNLHDHHVVFRSHGGGNARDNRVTVCAAHHLHGIHAGVVRVEGTAPDGLLWELGCAAGKGPLMRMHGDSYT